MISITHTISELIYFHDCVIVPGLGGFVTNYQSADINIEKGLFTPPNKEIGFNRKLTHNDGLLYHSIAKKTKCDYNDAKQLVDDFVMHVNFQINNNNFCVIGDIGELSKDESDNYLFTPNASGQFLADAYGLSSFHVALPNHIKNISHQETPIRNLVSRALVKRGVAASIGLFVGLFLITNEVKNPQNISLGSLSHITESISIEQPADDAIVTKHENRVVTPLKNKPAQLDVIDAEEFKYHLVIASFPNKKDADRYARKMIQKGYDNCKVIASPGKNRVAIEHFTNRSKAFMSLDEYRQNTSYKTAWLLKIKI